MRPDGPRDTVAGPDNGPAPPFPLRLNGEVIKGFGRGSSELGIPTANIPLSGLSVGGNENVESGVYYGWAGLSPSDAIRQHPPGNGGNYTLMAEDVQALLNGVLPKSREKATQAGTEVKGAVYPMVMSIGWNPYYKNEVRSVEVHIMHNFETDFYGSHMNLLITGFIRPEYDYVSKESLIDDIKKDIDVSGRSLSRAAYAKLMHDPYLLDFEGRDGFAS